MPLASRDIDYFLEVARRGQLAAAATGLDVTPAALSKAVRRLEEEMGLRLFERSGQGRVYLWKGHAGGPTRPLAMRVALPSRVRWVRN